MDSQGRAICHERLQPKVSISLESLLTLWLPFTAYVGDKKSNPKLESLMNIKLLYLGGILNFAICVFHTMFWKLYGWPENLLCLVPDDQARMQVLDILLIPVFAFFAFTSLFQSKAMLSTSLGRTLIWFIVIFYFVRIVSQIIFWNLLMPKSIVIIVGCGLIIVVYLVSLFSYRNSIEA